MSRWRNRGSERLSCPQSHSYLSSKASFKCWCQSLCFATVQLSKHLNTYEKNWWWNKSDSWLSAGTCQPRAAVTLSICLFPVGTAFLAGSGISPTLTPCPSAPLVYREAMATDLSTSLQKTRIYCWVSTCEKWEKIFKILIIHLPLSVKWILLFF